MPKDKTDYYSPKNTRKNKKKKNKKKLKHGNKDDDDDIDDVASNIDFQKLLYTMFPSKHQQEKVQKMEAMDKLKDNVKENKSKRKKSKKKAKNSKKSNKSLNMEVIANIMNECDVDVDDAIDLLNKYDNNDKLVLKYHTKPVEEETYESEEDVEEDEDSEDTDDDSDDENEEENDEEEEDEDNDEEEEQQFNIKFVVNEKEDDNEEEEEEDDEENNENKGEISENTGGAVMNIDFGSILSSQFNKMYNYDYGIEDDANYDEEGDEDYVCNSDDEKWINAVDNVEKMLKRKKDVPLYERGDEITIKLPSWSKEYEGKITNIFKLSPKNKNKKKKKKKKHIKFCYKVELINLDDIPDEILEDDLENVDEQYISKKTEEEDIEKESENEIKLTELKTKLNGILYLLEDISKKTKLKKSDKVVKQSLLKDKKKIENKIQKLNKRVELEGKAKRFVSFRNLLKEQSNLNHLKYFRNMKIDEQDKIVKTLKKVNDYGKIEKPYIISVLNNDMPIKYKSIAVKKINSMNYMDPSTGEYYKMKHWVDNFMRIPFSVNCQLPITIEDGTDKVNDFMDNAKGVLDGVVYGLEDAKMQIMQMIGQWITNPTSVGTAIAIKGPMGTGKNDSCKRRY